MKIATRAAASAAAVGIAASGMLSLAVGTAAADPEALVAPSIPVGHDRFSED